MRPALFFVPRPGTIARGIAVICAGSGLIVLTGYAIQSPFLQALGSPDTLSPVSAVLFIIMGLYLVSAVHPAASRRFLRGCGVVMFLVCTVSFLMLAFGNHLPATFPFRAASFFQLFPDEVRTRQTAPMLAFMCAALAVIVRNSRPIQGWMILPMLPLFWASYLSLTSRFYRIQPLDEISAYITQPLPAALLFSLLLAGFLATQPDRGFMAALNRRYIGGVLATVAFPVILITPFTVGWLRIHAVEEHGYQIAAFSQFATTNVLIFGAFVWVCAHMLNRIDARRQRTMASLRRANNELQRVNSELQRLNAALEAKIQEQIRTEDARQKTELQLFQSQKMEAMGTLAAGIAHDFNNLLTVILLNTEDALEAVPAGSSLLLPLGEIRKSGVRAAEVVRQIMTFGRKSPGSRTLVHLGEMAVEAADMLRRSLPPRVTLRLESLDDLPLVQGDPTQIQQVLINLGTNAGQAMAESGGILEFTGKRVVFPAGAPLPHPDLHHHEYACLCVRDQGCGIDEENLKRVFDPFFTTKPPGKGTGLGLSIVHGIMQLHQGCVLVHSMPGEGATFTLYFPLMPGEHEAAAA